MTGILSSGKLSLEKSRIILKDVAPHISIRLKNVFARIPKTQTKEFSLPRTDEMCSDLLWFMDRYPLEISSKDLASLKRADKRCRADRAALEAIQLPGWKPPEVVGFRMGYALYDNQAQANEILRRRKSLLLGDDLGQGKTWVAMAAAMRRRPTAVVVQAHLPDQWVNEFIVPYTELTAHIIQGTVPYDLPDADVYIFKYSNIAGWVDIAATGFFKLVVFDEIQDLRTGFDTSKGAAALVFAQNAEERLGLSATPVFNYGSEIWNILAVLDPEVLGPFDEFTREWCHMGNGNKWIVNDPDALGSYLKTTGVFLRRVRQGRPVNRLVIDVDYDDNAERDAEDLARALAMKVLEGRFGESGRAAFDLDALARRVTGIGKARGIASYARILLQAKIPVIISAWHRDVYEILQKELADFKVALYTGSETISQKNKVKRDFIAGRLDCILISNRSGAGLDGLQKRCSTLIVGELDWSPQIYEQLLGRVDRPGQPAEEITMIVCTCEYGSDPTIMSVNAVKSDQARGIVDPGSGVEIPYSNESHIKQLAREYLERNAA